MSGMGTFLLLTVGVALPSLLLAATTVNEITPAPTTLKETNPPTTTTSTTTPTATIKTYPICDEWTITDRYCLGVGGSKDATGENSLESEEAGLWCGTKFKYRYCEDDATTCSLEVEDRPYTWHDITRRKREIHVHSNPQSREITHGGTLTCRLEPSMDFSETRKIVVDCEQKGKELKRSLLCKWYIRKIRQQKEQKKEENTL